MTVWPAPGSVPMHRAFPAPGRRCSRRPLPASVQAMAGTAGRSDPADSTIPAGPFTPPAGYLDAVAGQPISPNVREAWQAAALRAWCAPNAIHHHGRQSSMLLEASRASVAASLSSWCDGPAIQPEEVWFASSAEAARAGVLTGCAGPLVTSAVDAVGVLDAADARPGSAVVGVGLTGAVDGPVFAAAVTDTPHATACLQFANAEVGTCQPPGPWPGTPMWLADASQCIGRIRLPAGWSGLWASARDWGGPPGCGIAVMRAQATWRRPAGTIRGWLDGSPDVPAAAAAAWALESTLQFAEAEANRCRALIDRVREQVAATVSDVEVLGDPVNRLPHVVTFSVLYAAGEALVSELDRRGFAVASGSACVAPEQRPSHVLAAMGAYTGGNIRVSLPYGCPPATVDDFLAQLPAAVAAVRGQAGA